MDDSPLVVCLTNTVAANFTANCLLAVGARPAMAEAPEEAADFAAAADGLLVNIGTVTRYQAETMRLAVAAANAHGVPWVLDPVGVQLSAFRRDLVGELLKLGPSLVRCNRDEAAALGDTGHVMLVTDAVDRVAGHEIRGGSPLLQSVTATGCALGGICAAMLGRGLSPVAAATAASERMKLAGERAFGRSQLPGGFASALIDALWELSHV